MSKLAGGLIKYYNVYLVSLIIVLDALADVRDVRDASIDFNVTGANWYIKLCQIVQDIAIFKMSLVFYASSHALASNAYLKIFI